MKNVTKVVICLTVLMLGILGLTLSFPYDQQPFAFGLIISSLLIVVSVLGLLFFIVRIFFVRKRS